jgi:hypothetical protein
MCDAFIRPVSERDKKALAALVAGPVLSPGDVGYADETSTINLSVVHQQALIVGAAVTADAELRHASQDSERDLIWVLRGGKSNFGVVPHASSRVDTAGHSH